MACASSVSSLPDCWEDPRSQILDPYDWDEILLKELILKWATLNHKLVFNTEDLKQVFFRNGKYPALLLNRVLDEMKRNGDIATMDFNQQSNRNSASIKLAGELALIGLASSIISRPSFRYLLIIAPTLMLFSWAKRYVERSRTETRTFVVLSVLAAKCEQFLQLHITSTLLTIKILKELTNMHPVIFAYDTETRLVLTHLQEKEKVAIEESSSDQITIKFIVPTAETNSGLSSPPANQSQKARRRLTDLKATEKSLNHQINKIECQMKTLEQIARTKLEMGFREDARAALRQRKQLESMFNNCNLALSDIENQILILEAERNTKEALENGVSALNNSYSDSSMNEKIDQVLEQQRKIGNIVSQSIVQEDESDLEEELKNILVESDAQALEQKL